MDDELYQVPLAEFTRARAALVARLEKAGKKDAAAEAARARRPSIVAWAANQVVWQASDEWDRLQRTTRSLRQAYETSQDVRAASQEQRQAQAACETRAARLLEKHGHAASPAVLQKVGHTLLALAYGALGMTPGRLTVELAPPGFEALAGLTLAAREPETRRAAKPKTATKTAVRPSAAELAEARRREAQSQRAVETARERVASREARLAVLSREIDAARQELAAAEADLSAARTALRLALNK